MRAFSLLILLLVFSCASPKPVRKIASLPPKINKLAVIDLKKSMVQIFPAVAADNGIWYYFYLQLKDASGEHIDCEPNEISLKTNKGVPIDFKYQKISTGRYYLTLEKTASISSAQMDFFVRGLPLKEQFQLNMRLPDRSKSSIKIIRNEENVLTFQLRLADVQNLPVETPDQPEILLEGDGSVEDMRHISEGVWEFKVIYPEQNQIMYFSVRAQGLYLGKLFRYQHVEK